MQPKVIAELGINHNGEFDTLLHLTDEAFDAGADYVKLQIRTPRVCVPKAEWNKPRRWFDGKTISYIEYKERMEFTENELIAYNEYVFKNYGNRWFASVWDEDSVWRLMRVAWLPFVKIPSALLTDKDLAKAVLESGYDVMMSTGMSTSDEILEAINFYADRILHPLRLTALLCNSTYPTQDEEVNLNALFALDSIAHSINKRYGHDFVSTGFSSHSVSPFPAIYSAVLGAKFIEVHFTLDRTMQGTDHAASLEKAGLELLCREVARIPHLLGDGELHLYQSEMKARSKLRGY